ncbi:twin transmembrane helix small protein [soil metagenome]
MSIKFIIIAVLLIVLYCLGSGLYYLITEPNNSERVAKALTWRISISLSLFIFLLIAYAMGWIHPHAL